VRRLELAAYVLLGALIAAALALTIVHASDEVYAIPGYGVVIAIGGAVMAAVGIALGWRARRGRATALAAVAGVFAVVSLLSFPPLLVLVVALTAIAVRTAHGGSGGATAVSAGFALGIGLHIVALIALSPPLVDCAKGSAGENVFLGLGSDSGSGRSSSDGDGTTRGRLEGDDYLLTYTCRGDELADFELRDR
jgi:hypothetical protein